MFKQQEGGCHGVSKDFERGETIRGLCFKRFTLATVG